MEPLILVANPGSASKKYALYKKGICIARVHIEYVNNAVITHISSAHYTEDLEAPFAMHESAAHIYSLFEKTRQEPLHIDAIAIRVVAPSGTFLRDTYMSDENIEKLGQLYAIAPLHIRSTLEEIRQLRTHIPSAPLYGISDSAFHAQKPDYTWNYGISLEDADAYEIKRYGYHGISLESVVTQLKASKFGVPSKTVVCHLGSGASVTALLNGKSVDTSMGYSPLEGLIMSTRSGTVEFQAGLSLARKKGIAPEDLAKELNDTSGLLGISGVSDDIRQLLIHEQQGHHRASLALSMYVYKIRQAVATMAASLEGIDALVFTGTVGQRSYPMRKRIVNGLDYLHLTLNESLNNACEDPATVTAIHPRTRLKPIVVVPTNEERTMASHARTLLLS